MRLRLWLKAKGVGKIPSAWLWSARPKTRAAGLSKMLTLSENSVLGEIRLMTFSITVRYASCSGVEGSGTMAAAIPWLTIVTNIVMNKHTGSGTNNTHTHTFE